MQRPLRAGSASGQESVLGKTVATVDRLSGGRFIFGVGVGWLAEEFQALGISIDRRAQRTREYIEVMRKLEVKDTLGIGANKRRSRSGTPGSGSCSVTKVLTARSVW